MALKMCGFNVRYDYNGKLEGQVSFSGDGTYISTAFKGVELEQIGVMIESIKVRLLDESAANLIQARDDMLALEHTPGAPQC